MRYLTIILLFVSSFAMAQRPYLFPTIGDAASNTYIGIGAYVQTQGYHASGDGGGALYRMTAVASAPMAADSGYVYPVTATKVLVQVLESEYLESASYGVKCGDSGAAAANYSRLQRYFNAIDTLDKQAHINGCNDTIYVAFSSAITVNLASHDKFVMRGDGADVTRIKASSGTLAFAFSDNAKVNLFDLYLHGYDATAFGSIGGADQSLTYVNDTLTISGGNYVVITGGGGGGTDDQILSIDSNANTFTLAIESGNSVQFSKTTNTDDQAISLDSTATSYTATVEDGGSITWAKVTDTDTDDQTLSVDSTAYKYTITIADGNAIDFGKSQDNSATNELQTITLDSVSGTYNLSLSNGGGSVKIKRDTDTDDQTLSFTSPNLSISEGNTVDLSALQDGTGTDDQVLTLDSVSGTYNLTIESGNTVKIKRDTDTDDQTLSLVTNTLSISEGNSVDLAAYLDNTDDQVISIDSNATTYTLTLESGGSIKILKSVNTDAQTLSFSNPNLSISGGNSVDISGIDTDTDDQTLSIDSNATTYTLTIVDGNNVKFAKGAGGGGIEGSGTTDYLARWDADTLTNSVIRDNGTTAAIGIGPGASAFTIAQSFAEGSGGSIPNAAHFSIINNQALSIFRHSSAGIVYKFKGRGGSAEFNRYIRTIGHAKAGNAFSGFAIQSSGDSSTWTTLFSVDSDGALKLPISSSSSITYTGAGTSAISSGRHTFVPGGPVAGGTSESGLVRLTGTYNGVTTNQEAMLWIDPTYSNTGTGLYRGIYVNPTISSGSDYWIGADIKGPTILKGLGTTSATYALLIEDSGGTDLLEVDNSGALGVGTSSPHASALVDMTSTSRGLLPPRMTSTQRDAISSPATGLTIYCTDCTATDTSTGVMQTYNGSAWKNYW